jgi:secondary thiamine-phosphate synthase enzyme
MQEISIKTSKRTDFVEITRIIQEIVVKNKVINGLCNIFVPHTTAGVTINEHADPDVITDITKMLDKIIPWNSNYLHTEGNSAAHIKASLTGSSQTIPVENGKLILGTWQGIFFTEFDGPRNRKILVSINKA